MHGQPVNREEWLDLMVGELRPLFDEQGAPLPDKIRVSCSWPSRSALSRRRRSMGECWDPRCSADGTWEIMVSYAHETALEAADTLVHELVHVAVGLKHGHRGAFKRLALAVGLVGPMRSTSAGPELLERLNVFAQEIGEYPGAPLGPVVRSPQGPEDPVVPDDDEPLSSGPRKQSNRMLKITCVDCGCVLRGARRWLKLGMPTCHCGGAFEPEKPELLR